MKRNLLSPFQFAAKTLCILIVILLQLPAITLAFDFRTSYRPLSFYTPIPLRSANSIDNLTVFSNPAAISVADRAGAATPNGISSPYPSAITVSGMTGSIIDVNVTITGITTPRERDLNFALVAPTGQALMLLGDGGNLFTMTNINLTFDDSAATTIGTAAAITSGTYQPTDHLFSATDSDDFPAPGPAAVSTSAPEGTATFATTFNGLNPNGNWGLYIVDDSLGGGTSSVSGGWSIDITTAGAVQATSTTVVSNLNPALTTNSITFTSTTTVVAGGAPVTAGTVSFTQEAVAIPGCTNVAVNASGQAACTGTLAEGRRNIVANYNGTASFGVSNGSMNQTINSPTVITGAQFCNNGGLSIADAGTAAPVYPSNVTVSSLFGSISNVNVLINGFNAPRPGNIDFMLVGPGGQAFEFMGDAGDSVNPFNGNLVLSDSGATLLPNGGAFAPGTYRPTDNDTITSDNFPSPAPGGASEAAPVGAATFASVYSSLQPNGTWSLYSLDDGIGGGNTLVGGWCVSFTITPFASTTTVTSSQNPSLPGQSVTFTATVTSPGGTPTGSVQFFDGATPIGGAVALNGAGQATINTSSLSTASHTISVQYAGASVGAGGGGFAASTGNMTGNPQVVTNTATWDGSASSDWNTAANWNVNVVPGTTNSINLPSAGVTNQPNLSLANTTVADLTVGANRTLTIGGSRTLTVNGVLTMNGLNIDATAGLLEIGGAGSITRTSGVVLGPMRKIVTSAPFAPEAPAFIFVYPVGTPAGLTPLSANFTAGSGSLTVAAIAGTAPSTPALSDATTLDSYWQLTEAGPGLTASLTFTYLQGDVDGVEANYRMIRSSAGTAPVRFPNNAPCPGAGSPCVDPTNVLGGTIFVANVQSFDNFWTAGEPLAPTAASVEVAGRVLDQSGRGIARSVVIISDSNGNVRQALTNAFGYYRFTGIESGRDYVVNVSSKSYTFQPRVLTVNDNVTDLDLVAEP